ncbi:MAG: response regulator [Desulfobulbaceae bacterium]|nr:response regulator [Desulfobulbaceae bacterium]
MNILIVEDDFVCRTLLQKLLTSYGSCHIASNGKEALTAFEQSLSKNDRYDLICLDIMMPEMDGQEALQEIRKLEDERKIGGTDIVKVIMITALTDPKNIMKAFIKGHCEAYITKPIDPDQLLAEMKKLGLIESDESTTID